MKKVLSLILILVMILSLVACGGGKKNDTADRTLNVVVSNDPGTLDPYSQTGSGGFTDIIHAIYDVPISYLQDGTPIMGLMESYDVVSETEYTLHLVKNAKFTNGNPFTAEDFMFSAELSRDNPQYSVNVKTWDFEKTHIIDDYTIDLVLTAYDVGMFPAMSWISIFDKESYNASDLALNPNGTGPYKLKEYVVNSHVIIEANPDYWGEQPKIKTVKFLVKNEDSQKVNALVTGDVDISRIPEKDVDYIKSLNKYDVLFSNSAMTTVAYFNNDPSGVLGSVDARKAVMHAINRDAIVELAYSGQSAAPTWPNSNDCADFEPRFDKSLDVYAKGYDPELAKDYAEKAGLVGKTVRIINNGAEQYTTIAQVIQENLSAIGVNSEIIVYDQATFMATMMDVSNFDIGLFIMSAPSRFAIEQMVSWLGWLPLGWTGDLHDEYIDLGYKGMATADAGARSEILQQMLDIFDQVHPWFALAEGYTEWAVSQDIGGFVLYSDGTRFHEMYWKDAK